MADVAAVRPWVLLGIVLAWGASLGGAFVFGQATKADSIEAQHAREEKVEQRATDAANTAIAAGIAKLRPINTTIRQETEREVRTNVVYADCRHPPEQLQRLNDALAGQRPERAASGLVPEPHTTGR